MEGTLLYEVATAATNTTRFYNLVQGLSIINSKGMTHTTRAGVPLVYTCDIRITCEGAGTFAAWSIPETWKARNAGVKWHKLRDHMFRESGISKKEQGRYGATIRPYFDYSHKLGVLDPALRTNMLPSVGAIDQEDGVVALVPKVATGGEWTYSDIVVTPPMDDGGVVDISEASLVDIFDLCVLGDHQITPQTVTEVEKWSMVGMIKSYLEDRMGALNVSGAAANLESVITPDNPLALLRSQTLTAGEVTDVASEQQEENPPYQTGRMDNIQGGDAYQADFCGLMSTGPTGNASFNPTITLYNVRVPYGLLAIRDETESALGVLVDIKVKRIEEMV